MTDRRSLELLEIHRETCFTFDERSRMLFESAPDRSRGRRFSFTGCRAGNRVVIRADVPDRVAVELERLVSLEPPLSGADQDPIHTEEFARLLSGDGAPARHLHGLFWVFPKVLDHRSDAHLVWSGSSEGDALVGNFAAAIATDLAEHGFRTAADLWEPWCVATVGGRIVSIAETVRSGPRGMEVGVDTSAGYRGRGFAAAVAAGWSRHRAASDRELFYSTARDNRSSRRVTERLGLTLVGSSYAIA